ncbi:MAG: TetR/AcrR family transcriptional regulator [Chloroflexota bacterium]
MPKPTFFNLSEEKRNRIIDLAIDEFAQNSFKTASISRIVKQAGIAKGSFYQYFDDKKDLYIYLIQLAGEQKAAFFNRFTPPDPSMGTFEFLRWVFSLRVQFEVENPKLNQIAYKAFFEDAQFISEMMKEGEKQADAFTKDLLARGSSTGDLDPNLDPELATFIFNSVFLHLGEYLIKRLEIPTEALIQEPPLLFDQPEAEQLFNGIMNILEKGMGKKES